MEPPNYSIENPNPNPNPITHLNNNNLPPSYEDSIININNDFINEEIQEINNNELILNNTYLTNNIINILNLLIMLSSCYYIFIKLDFFIALIIINLISYWLIHKYNLCGYIILFLYTCVDIIFKIIIFDELKETNKNLFYIYFIITLITYLFIYYLSCKIIRLLSNISDENLILLRQGYRP